MFNITRYRGFQARLPSASLKEGTVEIVRSQSVTMFAKRADGLFSSQAGTTAQKLKVRA
jgi:hypothetical protein